MLSSSFKQLKKTFRVFTTDLNEDVNIFTIKNMGFSINYIRRNEEREGAAL